MQVAGPFLPQFEIYWNRLDPQDTGKVSPLDAAKFLKSSGLSDQTLGKVRYQTIVMKNTCAGFFFSHSTVPYPLEEAEDQAATTLTKWIPKRNLKNKFA